jgi:hypothetical protein
VLSGVENFFQVASGDCGFRFRNSLACQHGLIHCLQKKIDFAFIHSSNEIVF